MSRILEEKEEHPLFSILQKKLKQEIINNTNDIKNIIKWMLILIVDWIIWWYVDVKGINWIKDEREYIEEL